MTTTGQRVREGYTVRDWVYVAVFGGLWGVAELSLGAYLHVLFPPLADTFLVGVIMAGIGAVIAMTGRLFVPKPWSILMIGLVTALLKVPSLGGIVVGPLVAITVEAVLMEAVLTPAHRPARWKFVIAGSVAVGWNFFHRFVMMRILFGQGIAEVYVKMVRDGSNVLGIDLRYALLIIGLLFLIRLIVGVIAGWTAWQLGAAVRQRLREPG